MVDIAVAELQSLVARGIDTTVKSDSQGAKSAADASAQAEAAKTATAVAPVKEAPKPEEQKQESMSERQRDALREAFKGLNTFMSDFSKSIRFAIFEQSGDLYAQVINTQTDEVVKTIPSEEALAMMNRIHDMIGMLVDKEG